MTTERWIEFCCWLVGEADDKAIRKLLEDWQRNQITKGIDGKR